MELEFMELEFHADFLFIYLFFILSLIVYISIFAKSSFSLKLNF